MPYIVRQLLKWGVITLSLLLIAGASCVPQPNPSTPSYKEYSKVSGGAAHTCALDRQGKAYCWGNNSSGQLGNGNSTPSDRPVAVAGGLTFTDISAGGSHSCGVSSGKVYCWGNNSYGQTGIGQIGAPVLQPTATAGGILNPVTSIYASSDFTCALTDTGRAFCWGHNLGGQLGLGSTVQVGNGGPANGNFESIFAPSPVEHGVKFKKLAVGQSHACGYSDTSMVLCWGSNLFNQVGVPSTQTCPFGTSNWPCWKAPVLVATGFTDGAAGLDSTCMSSSGPSGYIAYCWGGNSVGELGIIPAPPVCQFLNGMSFSCLAAPTLAPNTQVSGLSGVVQMAAGTNFVCASRYPVGTSIACWGKNNHGQLGDGSVTNHNTPVSLVVPLGSLSLSAGHSHACTVTDGNIPGVPPHVIYCWGSNISGQLGIGSTTQSDVTRPTRVVEP